MEEKHHAHGVNNFTRTLSTGSLVFLHGIHIEEINWDKTNTQLTEHKS